MRKKILVVDDNESALNLLKVFLTQNGYEVTLARDGKEAFDLIRKRPFPLVITDIKMPRMDGIKLIEKIKNTYPMIRVIMITGHVKFRYGLSAFTNGAETIIFKPFDFDKLKHAIERSFEFLDQWERTLKELQELKKGKEEIPGGNETVLFVDNDKKIVDFAKFNLTKNGYRFLAAENGNDALDSAEKLDGGIDLLITSVKLEDMYGKELFEELKRQYPQLKLLYLVSYKEDIIFEDDVMHEEDDYIYSPFTQKVLLKEVRKKLDKK